jgi:hypothetical protein
MRVGADPRDLAPTTWKASGIVAAMVAAGFALTMWVFYPGVLNYDSRYVYEYSKSGHYGDWQSPVMTVLWRLIDPLDPGSGSMFLLITAVYWLAFGLLALALARQSLVRAVAVMLVALSPPAFMLVGMIWRDVLFAGLWLMAGSLVLLSATASKGGRLTGQAVALGLVALGVLLRPNAVVAAPLIAGYVLWPHHFSWQRTALLFVPVALLSFALVQVVYYGALGAKREQPLHSTLVFDLGGITHFTKTNQFPGSWSPAEIEMLTTRCYLPSAWDNYWTREPCDFVMKRLEADKTFGSAALVDAWLGAVTRHPSAYLQHRAAFTWTLLTGANLTIWTLDLDDQSKTVFPERPTFRAVVAINDILSTTPLLRGGTWLLLCLVVCAFGWRVRASRAGAFALGVCGSAILYVLMFVPFGVAEDFRYCYWAVLAGLAGAVVIWSRNSADRPHSPAGPRPS